MNSSLQCAKFRVIGWHWVQGSGFRACEEHSSQIDSSARSLMLRAFTGQFLLGIQLFTSGIPLRNIQKQSDSYLRVRPFGIRDDHLARRPFRRFNVKILRTATFASFCC